VDVPFGVLADGMQRRVVTAPIEVWVDLPAPFPIVLVGLGAGIVGVFESLVGTFFAVLGVSRPRTVPSAERGTDLNRVDFVPAFVEGVEHPPSGDIHQVGAEPLGVRLVDLGGNRAVAGVSIVVVADKIANQAREEGKQRQNGRHDVSLRWRDGGASDHRSNGEAKRDQGADPEVMHARAFELRVQYGSGRHVRQAGHGANSPRKKPTLSLTLWVSANSRP